MKKVSIFLIVLAGVFWGTSAIFTNLLSPYGFTPLHMTAMRSIVASLVMTVYILIKEPKSFKADFKQLFLYTLGGAATFATAFFYYESINEGSVAVAAMLMYTSPIIVVVYSTMFFGEKLNALKLGSIIIMLLGCALVSGIIGNANSTTWGICAGLLSALCYGSYSIVTKIQMNKNCNPSSASLYCFITMAFIAFAVTDVTEVIDIASKNPIRIYPLIIGIGTCTVAIPYFLYAMSLKHIPAGTAASLSIVEPVMATVYAAMFFEGMPDIVSIAGIVLVVISVIMISKSSE